MGDSRIQWIFKVGDRTLTVADSNHMLVVSARRYRDSVASGDLELNPQGLPALQAPMLSVEMWEAGELVMTLYPDLPEPSEDPDVDD